MGVLDFFGREAGQRRTRALNDLARSAEYFIPPELRPIVGLLSDMTPSETVGRASQASERMLDADRTAMQRVGDFGTMASEIAGVVAPAAVAGRAGLPAAQALQESILGFSMSPQAVAARNFAADEAGAVGRNGNPVMQPFDMGRGFGDNGGPTLDTRVPYSRSGEEIAGRLADVPSAKSVAGVEDKGFGAGFTNLKQKDVLTSHQSTGYLSDEIVPPQVQTSIAPLLGRDVLAIVGDPTGRHTVTGVGGDMLPEAVDSKAGFQYIDVPGQGYAGAQSATSSKANEAMESQDPYYMSFLMGEQSGDFSRHQGNIFGQMFNNAPISASDVPKVNEAIRGIGVPKTVPVRGPDGNFVYKKDGTKKTKSITVYPFTDFDTVAKPNAVLDYINDMPTGTMRAGFLKGMDKSGLQKMGVPKVSDARIAAADERQIGMDWGTVGYRGFTPDLDRGLYPTTSVESTTYDTGIGKVGEADTFIEGSQGIPANLFYRDKAEGMREKGTGGGLLMNPADYKGYEGSPKKAKQRIDEMAVETIDTFLEIERRQGRQAALQYAGSLLSGGKITSDLIKAARKANAPTWMLAAMAPATGLLAPSAPQEEQY
jgi:hypothetical protein